MESTNEIFGGDGISKSLLKGLQASKVVFAYDKHVDEMCKKMKELVDLQDDDFYSTVIKAILKPEEIAFMKDSLEKMDAMNSRLKRQAIAKKFGL